MPKQTATLGTISHGTLRDEDLLSAFIDELARLQRRGNGPLLKDARKALRDLEAGRETEAAEYASDTVQSLADALCELAPPYCYFGANEGDGSDYGFWFCQQAFEDARNDGDLMTFADTGEAARLKRVGEFCVVSDHGNVSIYVRHANGRIRELISAV